MQTIIGSTGTIGKVLANELRNYTDSIRLVSRTPKKINPTDELFPADVNNPQELDQAIQGSSIVYVVVGFEYKTKVWKEVWPSFILNVIDSCERHRAKLVFFDNVYAYAHDAIPHMTEESALKPQSEKGKIRLKVLEYLLAAQATQRVEVVIARAADFIGPENKNSFIVEMVFNNLKANKAANWLITTDKIHSFTYTPDAARALALLGNTADAYGQSWHLPCPDDRLTGNDWIELFAKAMNKPAKKMVLGKMMLTVLGLFIPVLKEIKEMSYQSEQDYFFDSSKFKRRFPDFEVTSYSEVVIATIKGN